MLFDVMMNAEVENAKNKTVENATNKSIDDKEDFSTNATNDDERRAIRAWIRDFERIEKRKATRARDFRRKKENRDDHVLIYSSINFHWVFSKSNQSFFKWCRDRHCFEWNWWKNKKNRLIKNQFKIWFIYVTLLFCSLKFCAVNTSSWVIVDSTKWLLIVTWITKIYNEFIFITNLLCCDHVNDFFFCSEFQCSSLIHLDLFIIFNQHIMSIKLSITIN